MGPSKRKGSVRRQVLDLNLKEDSPSRPTWQTKYQHVLPSDEVHENGDSQSASGQKNNPLSGLLGNYNSDSDSEEAVQKSNSTLDAKVEDFLKEIHSISAETSNHLQTVPTQTKSKHEQEEYSPSVTAWQQCYDHNSGYPYYWNTETNEVTWEMPEELKTALTNLAIKQQEQQQSQLANQQQQHQMQIANQPHLHKQVQHLVKQQQQPTVEVAKKVCKYPWQTESDSEDEKIEMITSFGAQSDEESEEEEKQKSSMSEKVKGVTTAVGPQLPVGPLAPYIDTSKIRSDSISLTPEDTEGLNECSYETSSLLAHGVQDTGPPGDDSFLAANESVLINNAVTSDINVESTSVEKDSENMNNSFRNSSEKNENLSVEGRSSLEAETAQNSESKHVEDQCIEKSAYSIIADDVIAQIEKETPPDYTDELKSEKQMQSQKCELAVPALLNPTTSSKPSGSSGIALIANYGDDSESEDNSFSEKHKSSAALKSPAKPLFPIEIPEEKKEKVKSLFSCMDAEVPKVVAETRTKEPFQNELESFSTSYNSEIDNDDLSTHKAFKRKKRLEFATTVYGPSTSKFPEVKSSSSVQSAVAPSTQYNMDPNMNERRGFGFSSLKSQMDSERKTYKNYGGIQFVKAETINSNANAESVGKTEKESNYASAPEKCVKEVVQNEEIEDAATLLREKVAFLSGGNDNISPIEHLAIELETLVLAWQQGALTPQYLLRWLNDKCADLIRHEKTAAPSGWTCLWDRKIIYFEKKLSEVNSKIGGDSDMVFGFVHLLLDEAGRSDSNCGLWKSRPSPVTPFWKNKRYYYRNATTKAIQWEYPNVEEKVKSKEGDVVVGVDEMDICDTPPHLSPAGPEKPADQQPSTPPPPVISDVSEEVSSRSPVLQPPPPPQISFCPEKETFTIKTTKKRKLKVNEINQSEDVGSESISPSASDATEEALENVEAAPPLPPMPPPPPPPPDESPPPLPDSPPPLPLDPDQPLPPGVDEPEYTLYRRVSPKHSYKKAQSDSSGYSAELMMTYGYGLPVQQVVSPNGQPMTMQMQPLDYHAYMHDPVSAPYLVQSAPTSHVIQCSAKKPKLSLNSELMSFYSDLAMLDASLSENNSNSESQTAISAPEPLQETSVVTTSSITSTNTPTTAITTTLGPTIPVTTISPIVSSTTTTVKTTDSVISNGVNVKKKKKAKATSGLALKKKGVSSLVAKWQQVQQEVRRDFSDDDDDVTPAK